MAEENPERDALMAAGFGMVAAIEEMLTAQPFQMTAAANRAKEAREDWFKAMQQIARMGVPAPAERDRDGGQG